MRNPSDFIQGLSELREGIIIRIWGWDDESIFVEVDQPQRIYIGLLRDLGWVQEGSNIWFWIQNE